MQGVTTTLDELFALRYLAQQLHLSQPKIARYWKQGNYQSPFRGRGMDFVETRIYQPGDDTRNINWAVTARTGKPHTKIYQQERERPIYLVIDFNSSMFFGTRNAFKSVIAARAAAVIAWASLKQGDRIGGLLLKNQCKIIPSCQNKQSLIEFFKQIITYTTPTNTTTINYVSAFTQLKKILRTGSLIYFLSDFYSLNDSLAKELVALSKRYEVNNIFIYDSLEKEAPKNGYYLFHDQITAGSLLANTTDSSFRAEYQAIFDQRLHRLKQLCFKSGMTMIELCTNDDIIKTLRQILGTRK